MMKKLPKQMFIIMILCAITAFGYTRPAINIHLSFFGETRTTSLSLATVFEDSESPLNNLNVGQSDLSDMAGGDGFMEDVMGRVVLSVVAYLATFVLLLAIFMITLFGKLKKTKIVMLAIALILIIVSGTTILTVPEIITDSLTACLGFLALFINVADLLSISLGVGYWIILSTLAVMLLIEISTFFITLRTRTGEALTE